MFSLNDGTLCSKKRDQMKVYGESFYGSFKRIKQEDQTQAKLEKNATLFHQKPKSGNARLIKPDVLHLDTKVHSETFEDRRTCLDLELNLSSSSSSTVKTIMKKDKSSKGKTLIMSPSKKGKSGYIGPSRSPSWLAFEGDEDNDDQKKQEMVTTVCMKVSHAGYALQINSCVSQLQVHARPDDHSSTKNLKTFSLFKLLC